MTAIAQPRPGGPGSAPPIRDVTDAEVARHIPLVHFTIQRLYRRNKLATELEYEDLVAVGIWAVWEALRRWEPGKGAESTYISSYIWGYVMKYQRDATKAIGWNRSEGRRIATIASLDAPVREDDDYTLLDQLAETAAQPDEQVELSECAMALHLAVEQLPGRHMQAVGRRELEGRPGGDKTTAEQLGISKQRVHQVRQNMLELLREALTC